MFSRPHPCLGWLHVTPNDNRRLMARLLQERDAALEADPIHSAMLQAFIDWTRQTWLPANLHRYEKQVVDHITYIDLKIDGLNKDLEHIAGGVLDVRDAAADLRDRLKRELSSKDLMSPKSRGFSPSWLCIPNHLSFRLFACISSFSRAYTSSDRLAFPLGTPLGSKYF